MTVSISINLLFGANATELNDRDKQYCVNSDGTQELRRSAQCRLVTRVNPRPGFQVSQHNIAPEQRAGSRLRQWLNRLAFQCKPAHQVLWSGHKRAKGRDHASKDRVDGLPIAALTFSVLAVGLLIRSVFMLQPGLVAALALLFFVISVIMGVVAHLRSDGKVNRILMILSFAFNAVYILFYIVAAAVLLYWLIRLLS